MTPFVIVTFKLVGEGHQLAMLRSGTVKCVSVGTDDKFEEQSTQTETIETNEEWTQNQLSSRNIRKTFLKSFKKKITHENTVQSS